MQSPKKRVRIPLWTFLLAVLLISAALYAIPHFIVRKPTDFSVRLGKDFTHRSRPLLTLADGTKYALNNKSELSHEGDTSTPVHELYLDGEAYLLIPETKQPLLIHAPGMDVRATQATLDINAYKGDTLVEASVFEGSAEITLPAHPEKKLQLLAGDKLIIRTGDHAATFPGKVHYRPEDSLYVESAWTKFRLAGYNTTLEELIPRLEHEFNTKIFITDDKLKKKRFSFMIEELNLELTLNLLQQVQDFHYAINNNEVYLKP